MRRIPRLFPIVALVAIAACAGPATQQEPATPAVDQAAIGAQIDSINTAFQAAVAAKDTNAVVSYYADDAQLLVQGMPKMTGPSEIRAGWSGFLQTPGLELTVVSTQKIVSQAGDLVVDIGAYSQKMKDPKGATIEDAGKYVTIFRKTGSGWKIIVDTFNSDKGAT